MLRYLMSGDARAFRTVRDRLDDILRIYRKVYVHRGRYDGAALRAIRAEYGVGRPVAQYPVVVLSPEQMLRRKIVTMMLDGMSQRATARALGIHLSKLQRTLAKGQLEVA